jgi:ribose 5-phosphate isomerase B
MATPKWRVVIGSDDAGYEYKEILKADMLRDPRVAEVVDVGAEQNAHTDYPHIGIEAAKRVAAGDADRALLICGTGLGMAISANKVPGVRAVTAHDGYSVERGVLSNNAQVLCIGQRVVGVELARHLVRGWLDLVFDPKSRSGPKVQAIIDHENALMGRPHHS